MKKVVVFPYHHDVELLCECKNKLVDFEVIGIISYKEDDRIVDDITLKYGLTDMSYIEKVKNCDAILILDNYRKLSYEKYYKVIEDAILYDKEIMITAHIADQLELSKYKGRFSVVKKEVCTPEELQFQYDNVYRSCLYDLDTPVIGVMGQGKNCGKFHCQLLLSRILENECQAVVLSSNPLGALYGFYTMPDFLYDSIPFYEKVIKFNTYIRMIERKENPDIIIIGIPEGIVPFEQREFNHFAEYALVITSAITIDAGILCTYFVHGKLLSKGIDDLMTFCSTKFGMPMEAMCISNIYCEVPHSDISPIIYEFLDDSYMCKYGPNISDIAAHVFDFRELDRMTTIVQNILCCLSSGIRVI